MMDNNRRAKHPDIDGARAFAEAYAQAHAVAPHRMATTCHAVAGQIEKLFGLRKVVGYVSTFDGAGDEIERAHAWNVAPDGEIIDATEGQFLDAWDYREAPHPDSKCANCGEGYFLKDGWVSSMFCGPDCRRDYESEAMKEAEIRGTITWRRLPSSTKGDKNEEI